MSKTFRTIYGNLGSDPRLFETSKGEILKFTVAESTGYGKEDVRWWDVAVFNEGLRNQAKAELAKGTPVALAGFADKNTYNGQERDQIVADRLGIVQPFTGTRREKAAAPSGYSADL